MMIGVVAIYLLFVYFSQYTSWDGLATWVQQHAILIPVLPSDIDVHAASLLMKDLLLIVAHLLTTLARLLGPGGAKAIVADSLLFSGTNLMLYWRHAQIDAGLPSVQIQNRTNLTSGIWTNIGLKAPVDGTNMWSAPTNAGPFFRLIVPISP